MLRHLATWLIVATSLGCVGDTCSAEPEFANDVMPILSKAGCNLGTCHGNLNGKGGLKLSLRGQDPRYDYHALVLSSRGRRINTTAPEQSLILQKATGEVAHRGGIRFVVDSPSHKTLAAWLRLGAKGPENGASQLVSLDVQPREAIVVEPQSEYAVQVTALFSDGTTRDVTEGACYELSNLNAAVDENGVVSRTKFGETTLIVRYLQLQRPVPIAFTQAGPDFEWSQPDTFNDIDTLVFAKLLRLKMNPSPLCDDSVFIRRAYLDAIGRIPTAAEAQEFVRNTDPNKRSHLIELLLTRSEFADFWAMKWADILRTEEKVLDTKGVEVFHGWIRDCIAEGRPLDEFVRKLVTGVGSTFEQPPANFYRANRDASTRGETVARLFLGTRLQCAKCHNHPFDRWTQDDYYQWSSLFSQLDYEIGDNERKDKLDKNEYAGDQVVLVSKQNEIRNPSTDQIAKPKYLGGDELSDEAASDRLASVASWLTSPQNELFVQSQVNFIWYQLLGVGIVDPIDDFRLTNPPTNPPLLELLASDFANSGFNVRDLVGKIMNSRVYQLSAEPNSTNINDETCFSRAFVRRLPAEVILDMQSDFLELPAVFSGYPEGIRAVQIPGVQSKQASVATRNS